MIDAGARRFGRRLLYVSVAVAATLVVATSEAADLRPTVFTKDVGAWNGLATPQQIGGGRDLTPLQAMMWKYTVRCALRSDQELEATDPASGEKQKFQGMFGIAPEWNQGKCDQSCQEKVSSCLIALTNRTGKHVLVSLLSAEPSMGKKMAPNDQDIDFPHQEGAFFGNVFSGEAYTRHGRGGRKAAQVKRFCASETSTCSGLALFTDAGSCQDVCEMKCTKLSDGSERCAASACRDPKGRTWAYPITSYMRNKIEAVNADAMQSASATTDQRLQFPQTGVAAATYERVDFESNQGRVRTFTARVSTQRSGAQLEVWVEGQRIGSLALKNTNGLDTEQTTSLTAKVVPGTHAVVLRLVGQTRTVRLSTIEFR